MKVQSEIYKGIEFIQISKLPEAQKLKIKQSLASDQIIKILKENVLLTDCVQFKHYSLWFDTHFTKEANPTSVSTPVVESQPVKVA